MRSYWPIVLVVFCAISFFNKPAIARTECGTLTSEPEPCRIARETFQTIRAAFGGQYRLLDDATRNKLYPLFLPLFNFREITMRSLGPDWKKFTEEEHDMIVREAREYLMETYVGFSTYVNDADKIEIFYTSYDGTYVTIETLLTVGDQDYWIDYKFRKDNGEWKIYDVHLDGYSSVNIFRGRFQEELRGVQSDFLFDFLMRILKRIFTLMSVPSH